MAGRILVIRGGAIGDFILTLPALDLLREAFPEAHIEILGYPHITALAEGRHYANETRCIESGKLAGFFNPKADLDPELCEYFESFHQVISYLFDPDGFFSGNLRRAGVKNLIVGNPKIGDHAHAAIQLAEPLGALALFLEDHVARFHPSSDDRKAADDLVGGKEQSFVAIHPGSGGKAKNWPIENWVELGRHVLAADHPLLVVEGESDTEEAAALRESLGSGRVQFISNAPLPVLGAVISRCRLFVGHDSGISHLAAATGVPCILLFGPTDPAIWAPANPGVRIIQSDSGKTDDIALASVEAMVDSLLADA